MNLNLSPNHLRFRISEEEFRILEKQRSFLETIKIPNEKEINFTLTIGEDLKSEVGFEYFSNIFKLELSPSRLETVWNNRLKKIGLEFTVQGIRVSLSVDVKSLRNKNG